MNRTSGSVRSRPKRAGAGRWGAAALVVGLALGGCATPPPAEPSEEGAITVLVQPFEVLGQEKGADHVARAFAESLSNYLGLSDDLRLLPVVPAGEPATSERRQEVAKRLITGTLTRENGTVRASLRLLDSVDGAVAWEIEGSSASGDYSELASGLARQTIQRLEASFPDLYEYIGDVRGGPQMARSQLAQRALDARRRGATSVLIQLTSQLVAEYPDDPASHVFDAWALTLAWDADPSSERLLARVSERLAALDRVDPSSPYGDLLRAFVYRATDQPDRARALYSRVLARRDLTSTARAWALRQRSYSYQQAGNQEAARLDAEEAVALDPANARNLVALSRALQALQALDDAAMRAQQAVALQPDSWRHHQRLGLAQAEAGRFDEAAQSIDRACRLGQRQEACANLAVTLHRAGLEAEASAAAKHAESLVASPWGAYNLACYRALAGQSDAAFDGLQRAFELGFTDVLIKTDSDLDSLRDDPRFEEIVAAIDERMRTRRQLSDSVFPWQARGVSRPEALPA
jgi:tetratricopeptide (TPR) repeat protein